MTEIQKQLEQLRIENDEDRRRMPALYAELRRYHSILVLDDTRRTGFSVSKATSQPNKTHQPGPQYIRMLDSAENGLVKSIRQKEETVVQFYTKLFSVRTEFVADDADKLLDIIPPDKLLLPEETGALVRPLSEEELGKALDQCATNSAPGKDGLPFEFWKNLKEIILPPFTEYCKRMVVEQTSFEDGWPFLLGTLLHRKGEKTKLNNYRMLSVMDTDLRWRAKALLNKMMPAFERFISDEQTAFMKNRQISDNIMAVMLAIEETRSTQMDGMILALDQEKAYDRVRWDWLFYTLGRVGVPIEMINAIRISYQSPIVRIAINKHLTPELKFECGVLQGDPLSVLLYIITIQPLLYALKAKGIGIKVSWEGRSAPLWSRAHADDLILFLTNELQYREAQPIIELYCRVSNATMHPGKATAIFSNAPDGSVST
jgi:hypothetical protein